MNTKSAASNTEQAIQILVVDGSKLVRRMIEKVLLKQLPGVEVIQCANGAEAREALNNHYVDLVTTALRLPDMDGLELCRYVRDNSPQRYIPVIVVSGDTRERLVNRDLGADVTDYFDKSLGFDALGAFIMGYVKPDDEVNGHILYVEDSRVVAMATTRMMKGNGMKVTHLTTVEQALEIMEGHKRHAIDVVLTDVYLKGGLTGKDLLKTLRGDMAIDRRELPILVMTGDDDKHNQSTLLKAGANDLVEKPIEERVLIAKLRFQLRLIQQHRPTLV